MPASLPGDTLANNLGNPTLGRAVIFDLASGPKGSPLDVRRISAYTNQTPVYVNDAANQTPSTGALQTGIGFGSPPIIGVTAPASIKAAGFNDDYVPGVTLPNGNAATTSILMYIGSGRSKTSGAPNYSNPDGQAGTNPYTAGFGIGMAGNGGSRDAGAGPAFTGFTVKTVTAVADVANGAVVETGFTNRSGVTITTGQSVFGSSTTASAAPTLENLEAP